MTTLLKKCDFAKKKSVPDFKECAEVKLPNPADEKVESELSMVHVIIMEVFTKYKKRIENAMERKCARNCKVN